tara:strand:+ start:180 stop:413 length:234 start_codon:yes stop_codon:yes gene_type:complete
MTGINWTKLQDETKARANGFVNAEDFDKIWYIGSEIVDAAIVCDAWDDNIHDVCIWQIVNGKGLQSNIASSLIARNT